MMSWLLNEFQGSIPDCLNPKLDDTKVIWY